jgi:O-antigen/teichoic acid export membrane protein
LIKKKAVSALIWSAAGQVGATGISTIFVLIFARFVSPEGFGIFAIGSLLAALSANLSGMGLSTALVQRETFDDDVFSTAFWISVGTATALAIAITALAGPIAALFSAQELAEIVPFMAFAMVMANATALLSAILRREMNLKALANRTIAANLTSGAVATPLVINGYGIYALVTQYVIAAGLTLILTIFLTGWRARLQFHRSIAGELLRYGIPVMKADFVSVFNMESPKFFIGLFLGTTTLGIYSMASRLLNMLLMIFATTLSSVAFPLLSETNRTTPERMKEMHLRILRLAALAYAPLFTLLAILSEEVVALALGPHWAGASNVTAILCLAGIPLSLGYVNGATAMALGHPQMRYRCILTGAVIGTLLLAVMAPFGLIWAGGALLLRSLVAETLLAKGVLRLASVPMRDVLPMLKVPVVGSGSIAIVAGLVYLALPASDLVKACCVVIFGMGVYASLVLLLDRSSVTEIRSLITARRQP